MKGGVCKHRLFLLLLFILNNAHMKKLFWIVSIMVLFQACTTVRSVYFERLQAADVNFPERIRSVGVVNNMPAVHQDYKEVDYSSASLEGDGDVATEALAQEVASVNYFDQVVLYDTRFRKEVYPLEQPIPKETVDELIDKLNVDMLLSMERVNVELKESTMFIPDLYATVPAVDGIVTSVVRAYVKQQEAPLFTIQKKDTLCWEIVPELTYGDIVKDFSEFAASMPMQYLLPSWKEVERHYFDGGNVNMRDAGIYVREQNWEQAYLLWKELYDTKKGKTKMRAAYNLALYYELHDDFVRAKECLDTAMALAPEKSWELQLILFYQLHLEEQAKQNQRLNVQMKRFE